MAEVNWSDFRNFSKEEFDCKETGENRMRAHFLVNLQRVRDALKTPIYVTSGFRSVHHSLEVVKKIPGMHTRGLAADIWVDESHLYDLIEFSIRFGFNGIGVSNAPTGPKFIHLDLRPPDDKAIWSYR